MQDPLNDDVLVAWLDGLADWDQKRGGPALTATHAYGPHAEQVVDVWMPETPVTDRTLIAVHGGYFMPEFGRSLQNPMVREWVRQGIPVYNIEYRRQGLGGGFHETTADVWAAVDWVLEWGGARKLAVVGHSAGGYLAQWLASHPAIGLALPLASVSDLAEGARSGLDLGAIARWMCATPEDDPALYRSSDLLARLDNSAPQVLIHGVEDTVVAISQGRDFHRAANAQGAACSLIEMPDEGHFGFLDPRQPAFTLVTEQLKPFFGLR